MADPGTVSVVVPLFNGGRFVSATLTSLERQTAVRRGDVRLEVIVVDDGSGDDGLDVVAGHPLPTTVLHQDHLGVAVARHPGGGGPPGGGAGGPPPGETLRESRG